MDLTIPLGPSIHGCDVNRLNPTESAFPCRSNTDRLLNVGSMCCTASRLSSDPLTPTLSAPRSVSASLQTSCPDYASVKHNQLDPVPSPISQEVNCAFYRVQPPDSVYLDPFPKSRSQQPLYQTPMWHLNTRPWLSIWNSSWRPDAHSERQQLASWLHAADLQRLEDCLADAGFSLWTLCRATPEELNACGITNPLDRQLLRTELNRVRVPDALPEKLPAGVKEWLSHLNLDAYWPGLRDQGFTSFERCAQLTWEDLEDVGVTKLGHQKKLLLAIERLQRQLRGCAMMLDPPECRIQMAIPVDSTASPLLSQKATFQHAGHDTTSTVHTPILECRSTHGRSFSATNPISVEDETPSTPDCENDSSPVPAPPPAFRDSTPDQLGKRSITQSHSTCVSRQRQAGERSVISLPPPVPPLRCSSMADNKDSPGLSSPYTKHHSLKIRNSQPFGRRGHSLLGHESRGSESDLFRNLTRRSSSPSLFQLNGDPQIPQLTKWASGHQKKLLLAIERLQRQLRGCAMMLDPPECRIQMAIPVDSTASPLLSQKATFQHAGHDTTSTVHTPILECRSTHGRSFSATNPISVEDETPSTPDCENDSSPVPAPPPAFRDSTPDQLGKRSITQSHSTCVSRQRQAGERSVISLPPPVPPLRCSSMADNKDSPGLSSPYTKHHSLKIRNSQPFGRRGHSLLGHESRGSESDLFRNLTRRSSSPSLFQLNGDPQIPQLTKWASGN
ncbi:hypothetical protein AHF37_07752 [Paragonimus kellicotti]|nr:hypothetical protein AHF37_07752 [Paragonimus kellicotti]